MGKSSAPDTSGQNYAAVESAKLGREQYDWFKGEYERTRGDRDAATARANEASDLQIDAARLNNRIAADQYANWDTNFRPIEAGIATDAQGYDTPARRAAAAAAAGAGVEAQISAQRDASSRALQRSGVDPSGGKTAAMMGSLDVAAAKAKAGASNQAEQNVETQGWARKMDAASLGRGIASSQATSSQIASQQGSASASTAGQALGASTSGAALMSTGFNGAMQGYGQSANIYGSIAQQQAQAQAGNNGLFSGLGSVAGNLFGRAATKLLPTIFSDENMKKDVEPTKDDDAMEAVRKMPVKEWEYREETGLPGGRHIGPMAQDVNAAAGDKAAPGGKMLDPITMNGITIAALQNVDRRLAKMEKRA